MPEDREHEEREHDERQHGEDDIERLEDDFGRTGG